MATNFWAFWAMVLMIGARDETPQSNPSYYSFFGTGKLLSFFYVLIVIISAALAVGNLMAYLASQKRTDKPAPEEKAGG